MYYLLKMAVRNIFRNWRRTTITFSSIAVGLLAMVVVEAMLQGIIVNAKRNIIDYQTSHLKVFAGGYFSDIENIPLDKTIADPQRVLSELRGNQFLKAATSRVQFSASISNGIDQLPCMGVGIDPENENSVFCTAPSIVEGNYLENGDDGILLGTGLARDFNIKTGDWITLSAWTAGGSINAFDFQVKGLIKTHNPLINSSVVFMPLKTAQDFVGLGKSVTEIDIKLKNLNDLKKAGNELSALAEIKNNNYEVITWEKLAQEVLQVIMVESAADRVFALIIFMIAAIGITNTMLMSVYERSKEIGMLMAMGMRTREIKKMFIIEGAALGSMGSFVGCFSGFIISFIISKNGIDLSGFGKSMEDAYQAFVIEPVLYTNISLSQVMVIFLFGIIICALASLYPASRATKFEPVEALRKS